MERSRSTTECHVVADRGLYYRPAAVRSALLPAPGAELIQFWRSIDTDRVNFIPPLRHRLDGV
jgi:hypothetical protein